MEIYFMRINNFMAQPMGGGVDGALPQAGVTLGPDGYLYGTTSYGGEMDGSGGYGVVFKLDTAGAQYRIMVPLSYYSLGGVSRTNVVVDAQLNVIGTTELTVAPNGGGSLFKVTQDGTFTTLIAFQDGPAAAAADPVGNLVRDSNGNIYGMLAFVGSYSNNANGAGGDTFCGTASNVTPTGCGTLFSLTP